jgi:L-rhamnose mutarotase
MRKAVFFRLKPGMADEYKRRHDAMPEDMHTVLMEAGFKNYSIWRVDNLLFAYYELEDEERMSEVLRSSPVYARWRVWMEDVVALDRDGQKEWPMELMFLHGGGWYDEVRGDFT